MLERLTDGELARMVRNGPRLQKTLRAFMVQTAAVVAYILVAEYGLWWRLVMTTVLLYQLVVIWGEVMAALPHHLALRKLAPELLRLKALYDVADAEGDRWRARIHARQHDEVLDDYRWHLRMFLGKTRKPEPEPERDQ